MPIVSAQLSPDVRFGKGLGFRLCRGRCQALSCMVERAGFACWSALGSFSPCFVLTAAWIRSPRSLSTLRQYSGERARLSDGLADAVEQVPDDIVDQALPRGVVKHLADHRRRLTEVVVVGVQGVGGAHHVVTVGSFPVSCCRRR